MSNELTGQAARAVSGVLGTKLGMTQVWDENGKMVPVTVVQTESNVVTQIRSIETDGYDAVQIAYGQIDPRKVSKPLRGHFEKAGVTPRRHLTELRTTDAADYSLGQEIDASIFVEGQKVDVVGTSKGKGTAGVMKRHGFAGVSATHGQHRNHRKPGSIGGASTPARVFKGMRMAGRMGNARTSVQNLTVHAVDAEKGLVLVKGAVPGPKGGLVLVRSAVKSPVKEA
jgi:large subunit ribosomal protein L3